MTIHVFPYSRRKGTVADRMPEQVPEETKHRRAATLSALEKGIREEILKEEIGKTYQVLFETDEEGSSLGHTPNFLEVRCKASAPLHGQTRLVLLKKTEKNELVGELWQEKSEKT